MNDGSVMPPPVLVLESSINRARVCFGAHNVHGIWSLLGSAGFVAELRMSGLALFFQEPVEHGLFYVRFGEAAGGVYEGVRTFIG